MYHICILHKYITYILYRTYILHNYINILCIFIYRENVYHIHYISYTYYYILLIIKCLYVSSIKSFI